MMNLNNQNQTYHTGEEPLAHDMLSESEASTWATPSGWFPGCFAALSMTRQETILMA